MRKNILLLIVVLTCLSKKNALSQNWSTLGQGIGFAQVNAINEYNGELVVGGSFSSAGAQPVNNVARWNGMNWSSIGNGVNGSIEALKVFNGTLYAGGWINPSGTTGSTGIAKWNGTNWVTGGLPDMSYVKSLTIHNGELYAGGYIPGLGGISPVFVAKWNNNSWTALGGGLEQTVNSVICMVFFEGQLYVSGDKYGEGGAFQNSVILKWNGINWDTIGVSGRVMAMIVHEGNLYVAGSFGSINDVPVSQVAKWDGSNWSAVGAGIDISGYPFGGDSDGYGITVVESLAIYNGNLYAGGSFSSSDSITTLDIARWNGTNWSPVGVGVAGEVMALCNADSSLYVGGHFYAVNGSAIPASNIAKWSDHCSFIPAVPGPVTGNISCLYNQEVFSVNNVSGASSYTWTLPYGWTGSSNTNSITVTPGALNGTIYVSANSSCASSSAQTLAVTSSRMPLKPNPINGNSTVCLNSQLFYSVESSSGASSYTWILPNGWAGNSNSNMITATPGVSGGIISVRANNSCGSSESQTLAVNVNPIPAIPTNITGSQLVIENSIQPYSVDPIPGATGYTWTLSAGGILLGGLGDRSINIHWQMPGSYELKVTANNICGTSPAQKINIKVSEADPNNEFDLIVFPNPSIGEFYLDGKRLQDKLLQLEILNASGLSVYRKHNIPGAHIFSLPIHAKHLQRGIYFIRITVGEKVFVRRIGIIK